MDLLPVTLGARYLSRTVLGPVLDVIRCVRYYILLSFTGLPKIYLYSMRIREITIVTYRFLDSWPIDYPDVEGGR